MQVFTYPIVHHPGANRTAYLTSGFLNGRRVCFERYQILEVWPIKILVYEPLYLVSQNVAIIMTIGQVMKSLVAIWLQTIACKSGHLFSKGPFYWSKPEPKLTFPINNFILKMTCAEEVCLNLYAWYDLMPCHMLCETNVTNTVVIDYNM